MPSILIIGASDTGRAPLAAALLRAMLERHGMSAEVGSAGVIGHDGDEMQAHAGLTLEHLGLTPPQHRARSLSDSLAEGADLLLAVDRGTARVLVVRYPQLAERIAALPQLANARDVPDPFHMSLDAWIVYGRSIHDQLRAALPELRRRLGRDEGVAAEVDPPAMPAAFGAAEPGDEPAALQDLRRLLAALQAAPEVIDWQKARAALSQALASLGSGGGPGDMRPAVAALLQGLLAQQQGLPNPAQLAWLGEAAEKLRAGIDTQTMAQLAADAAQWQRLATA